jgi:hypothetical protein
MGSIFSRHRFGLDSPSIGLLSIGEEPGKGDSLRKEAYPLLVEAAADGRLNFIGNVEGRDVMSDAADVIVADGFTGNVVLKTLEGGLKTIVNALLEAFSADESYKPHADALMPALLPLYEMLDPETYGGAMLLGVDGVCIISHGSSSERAIVNAINVAREMVEADVVGEISAAVAFVMVEEHNRTAALPVQLVIHRAAKVQLFLQPHGNRLAEVAESPRGIGQHRLQQALELRQRLVVEGDVVELLGRNAGSGQARGNCLRWEACVVLLTAEPLFLGSGDDLPVTHERRRAVVIESRDAEDRRHGFLTRCTLPCAQPCSERSRSLPRTK